VAEQFVLLSGTQGDELIGGQCPVGCLGQGIQEKGIRQGFWLGYQGVPLPGYAAEEGVKLLKILTHWRPGGEEMAVPFPEIDAGQRLYTLSTQAFTKSKIPATLFISASTSLFIPAGLLLPPGFPGTLVRSVNCNTNVRSRT
jgi:hypothetical protein